MKSARAKIIALSGCCAYPLHIPDPVCLASDMEAVVFLVIIIWISLCFVVGAITENKGNSFRAAFLISLLLSPIIGIVFALAQRPNAGHR